MRLEKKLKIWEDCGLISTEQKDKICDYEKQHHSSSLFNSIIILGIFIISIGILSLIAANWSAISDSIKIVFDFLLLFAVAGGSFYAFKKEKLLWFEGGILALFILCGASIGLIGQVFQTNGTFYQWGLFWALLTFPFLFISKRKPLAFLWVALLAACLLNIENLDVLIEKLFYLMESNLTVSLILILAIGEILINIFTFFDNKFYGKYPIWKVCVFYVGILMYFLAGSIYFQSMYSALTVLILTIFLIAKAFWNQKNNRPQKASAHIATLYIIFIMEYFELFGSLLQTGLGLVATGILLIVSMLWVRRIIRIMNKKKEAQNAEI